jgi:peptidoglycan/xylan/chitin deacetylase (PgdA/CDA1 family)
MRLHWLLPTIKGIPVLMYHKVWEGVNDRMTIAPDRLSRHWEWLKKKGYQAITLPEFLAAAKKGVYHKNTILITFDDGYTNNLQYVYPLLKSLNWAATFFIIADNVDGTAEQSKHITNKKMNLAELKQLDPAVVQLGMHGYNHENFSKTNIDGIKKIIEKSLYAFDNSGLVYHNVLAYPYGARPEKSAEFTELKKWMQEKGMEAAFRIGNQVCKIPAPDLYEIKRIDIRGTDSIEDLKIKLKKGKLKPF